MTSYVQLTLKEYDELKEVQKEATTTVEKTNTNLKNLLDTANSRIAELEAENRKYALGGARERPDTTVASDIPAEDTEVYDDTPTVTNSEETPPQTRNKAQLGRRRWTKTEVDEMKLYAEDGGSLIVSVAALLNRTASSIKTQANRMGLSCKNGTLSEK